jgi:hypothetical protein
MDHSIDSYPSIFDIIEFFICNNNISKLNDELKDNYYKLTHLKINFYNGKYDYSDMNTFLNLIYAILPDNIEYIYNFNNSTICFNDILYIFKNIKYHKVNILNHNDIIFLIYNILDNNKRFCDCNYSENCCPCQGQIKYNQCSNNINFIIHIFNSIPCSNKIEILSNKLKMLQNNNYSQIQKYIDDFENINISINNITESMKKQLHKIHLDEIIIEM